MPRSNRKPARPDDFPTLARSILRELSSGDYRTPVLIDRQKRAPAHGAAGHTADGLIAAKDSGMKDESFNKDCTQSIFKQAHQIAAGFDQDFAEVANLRYRIDQLLDDSATQAQ